MGRRKIEIKPIRDDRNRSVTFLKRKGGLFKKAHELSVLCSVDVAVVIFGHNKKLYEYSSSDINDIIGRFQYYGGAHEHKGPADFSSKDGGDDDDEDGDIADDPLSHRGTPGPQEHGMLPPHMQNHPGFQHVRHGTPGGSPPIHNGPLPQFQRGPSPLPPGLSRPSSRADQHPGHVRRPSSNLAQQSYPQPPAPHQPTYAYTPNPPFYTPPQNAAPPPPRTLPGHQATYPPAYPQQQPVQQQVQQAFMGDGRRSSGPPAFSPQPPSQPELPRHPSQEHLQPLGPPPTRSPQPQHRPTPSPQPPQQSFASPPLPQPKPLPAHAKHNIFTPIDDSRSMLAQHWGSSNVDPAIKDEGGPRSQSLDVASMHRGRGHVNGSSPRPPPAPLPRSAESDRPQSSNSMPGPPTRSNTAQSDAKRPRLKVQIPSEQSGDEGDTTGADEAVTTTRSGSGSQGHQQNHGVVLPPPSPSAGALLSAGAQGPPNPFARPAPPMNSQAHAMPRDETPISALPSRFMSDNLLPSPSTFYPDWNFGRSGDSNMLPSPLNFQTPVTNGQGWREEDKKRANEDDHGGDVKRAKT